MKKLKKRFIVPAVVFILGMCALIGTIYVVGEDQEEQNRTKAQLNAMTYLKGLGVGEDILQALSGGDESDADSSNG